MKYSIDLDIDIVAYCWECGELLSVKRDKQDLDVLTIEVTPCQKCIEAAKEES